GGVAGDEGAGAGDVVGVDVGVDDVAQAQAALAQDIFVGVEGDGGIDDGRLAGVARGDGIGRTSAPFIEDLLEVHSSPPLHCCAVGTSRIRRVGLDQAYPNRVGIVDIPHTD